MTSLNKPVGLQLDAAMLERYLAGACAELERVHVEAWLDSAPDRRAKVALLRERLAVMSGESLEGEFANVLWREFKQRQTELSSQKSELTGIPSVVAGNAVMRDSLRRFEGRERKQTLRKWRWLAGITACLAFATLFLTKHTAPLSGVTRTYRTVVGQRATLVLGDGTRVMMAPQTTLSLGGFGQQSRTVVLVGDAYFDVARSAGAPFIVQSGTTTTRVLGTAFEVRHYPDEIDVRVAVAAGKVLMSNGGRYPAIPITAGHVASVTDSTPTVKAVDNIDTEIGWLGNQLLFQNAPMPKVLATLTRWYGYQFRCADSTLVSSHITIGLSMRSSAEALASLEQILNVSLTVVGDTVTLIPARTRGVTPQRMRRYDVWIPTREVGR